MALFVLVPGAWHGAWTWRYVAPALERLGHRPMAIELPGMGVDRTPVAALDMSAWITAIADEVAAAPEPVVLVGHSRGGLLVSAVADRVPDRIALSIYVSALLPVNGETATAVGMLVPPPDRTPPAIGMTIDGSALLPSPEVMARAYRRSPPDRAAEAMELATPEPLFAIRTPILLDAARYGRVPRAYVECLDDEVVSLDLQRAMQARQPCQIVRRLDADHCPTFSAPEALVAILDELGRVADAPAIPLNAAMGV